MAKCDVCGKTSLLPEKFGTVNVCKICFMKANGPFWKHQYDRHEDAEKHRCKALEAAHKNNFPQLVVSAINDFFVEQMNSMLTCDCCGMPVQHRQSLGKANICKECFGKINTSAWKATEYDDNEEVEQNREKILKIANKRGFPPVVIEGINNHFDSKIQPGLICTVSGGVGQKLKVYETHCILHTSSSFETETMSKRYGKALKKSRPQNSSFGSTAAKALALGALIPGVSLVGAGVRAATAAAITVVADKFISGKGTFRVVKGDFKIDYAVYGFADFGECGDGENDVGFIRFARNGGDPYDDIVFLYHYNQSKVKQAYQAICQGIEQSHQPQTVVQEVKVAVQNNIQNTQNNYESLTVHQAPSSPAVADELLKFKQLLDMGAITQEEFDAKKKQLLEL